MPPPVPDSENDPSSSAGFGVNNTPPLPPLPPIPRIDPLFIKSIVTPGDCEPVSNAGIDVSVEPISTPVSISTV